MYGLNAKDRGKQVPMDWSREPYEPSSFGFALEGSMTSEPKRVLHGAGAEQQSDPVCDMDKSENDNTNENRSEDSNSNSKSKSKGLELAVALTSCSSPLRQEPGSSSVIAKRPFFRAKTPTSALSMEPSASHRQDPRQRLYLPYILIGYLQLIWNVILVVLFLYCMYAVYMVLSEELSVRMASSLHSMVSEARQCRHLYESNRCAPLQRVPALEKDCSAWEYCMNRDGESEYGAFGKCKLIAETVADTMNAFVEKISYKTMASLC